jgi:flagellar hook assembly protein FlgD
MADTIAPIDRIVAQSAAALGDYKQSKKVDNDKEINDLYMFLSKSMECQDPFAEFDASKMAANVLQIKSCENALHQKEATTKFADSISEFIQAQDNHFLGHELAAVPIDKISLKEGKSPAFAYQLKEDESDVVIKIYDADQKLVYQTAGNKEKGIHRFEWNGMTNITDARGKLPDDPKMKDGNYKIEALAMKGKGKYVNQQTLGYSPVVATERNESGTILLLKGSDQQCFRIPVSQLKESGYSLAKPMAAAAA